MGKAKLGMPLIARPFLIDAPVAASQVFKRRSGHFVRLASNNVNIAGSGHTEIWGWALVGKDWTSSATAGASKVTVDTHPYHVWEIPSDATFTASGLLALIGDTCDLIVNSNIQQADVGENTEKVIVIIGGDVDNQTLYVHMNPNKCYATGVV